MLTFSSLSCLDYIKMNYFRNYVAYVLITFFYKKANSA